MTPSSGVNRTATSQDTTSAIAITANREKQYSPALLRAKPMGMKAGYRDQGAGQHRERGGGIGVSRSGEPIEAALEPAHHHLDRHHRVVDQQAESDDESTERDPLKRDAAEGHAEKDDGQDERDRQCDDRAGPQSEGQKADGEHDCDGFPERLREAADRGSGDDRLIGDEVRLDPDRQIGLDLFHAPPQRVAEAQNVGALGGSHRQADGRLAVEPKHRLRRIGIPSPNRRDVSQAVKSPVGVKVDIS
jgi:hypothetical protein